METITMGVVKYPLKLQLTNLYMKITIKADNDDKDFDLVLTNEGFNCTNRVTIHGQDMEDFDCNVDELIVALKALRDDLNKYD